MLVDGRALAEEILSEVAKTAAARPLGAPRLSAITCAPNFETKKYLEMKKQKAVLAGINLNVVELPDEASTQDVVSCVETLSLTSDGIVVQLPLPLQVDVAEVIASVPVSKDPDGFQYAVHTGACLPPVVGAIDEISARHHVVWEGKKVVVLGEGRLVGKPAAAYARGRGAEVMVLTKETYDPAMLPPADIIVAGIGRPHFITPDLVQEGVIVFDAGTSEDGGELVGDVDPSVALKAALLTPVPGGIGPITIAYLLKNLLQLAR